MGKVYVVRVKEEFRWSVARVGGRNFSKDGEEINEADLTEEIRNAPMLVVEEKKSEVRRPRSQGASRKAATSRKKSAGKEGAGGQGAKAQGAKAQGSKGA